MILNNAHPEESKKTIIPVYDLSTQSFRVMATYSDIGVNLKIIS